MASGTTPFLTLERKLPILIGGLVACVLLVTLALVHVELRQSAVTSSSERLTRVTDELAEVADSSIAFRSRSIAQLASTPDIRTAADGGVVDRDSVVRMLRRGRPAADSLLPVLLRLPDGSLGAWSARQSENPAALVPPDSLAPLDDDSVRIGPLHRHGDRAAYWATAPVTQDGRLLGHVMQLRPIGSRGADPDQFEQLIGGGILTYVVQPGGGVWGSLDGEVLEEPEAVVPGAPFIQRGQNGEKYLAYAAAMGTAPFLVVSRTPYDYVVARSNDVLRNIALAGLLLMLVGGAAAWLVSLSVTRPLRRLGTAADAIALGEYGRRTGLRGGDEIGQLAATFDAMADKVEASHRELDRRYSDANKLAFELETTNRRLHAAVEELEAARLDANQANTAKSEFLATMSHEIRTPINAVIGYTDLLEMGLPGPLNEQQHDFVSRIRISGQHLISLVNDVLDFAKIESGQLRIGSEVGAAHESVAGAVAMLHARAAERRIQLHTSCAASHRYLADTQRVQQVLINLLSNAIKFTDDGGAITISCQHRRSAPPAAALAGEAEGTGVQGRVAHWTCIDVADNGPGVPADQHEHIFEPFIQGAAGYTRPHGGTGLGLAISRSLARMMGGDLTIESASGAGATFTLWLPAPSAD